MATKRKVKTIDPDDQKRRLGERLKQLRTDLGYTSAEKFANDKGFQRATYGKLEQGKPEINPEFDTLIRLANAYGITMKELFSEGLD